MAEINDEVTITIKNAKITDRAQSIGQYYIVTHPAIAGNLRLYVSAFHSDVSLEVTKSHNPEPEWVAKDVVSFPEPEADVDAPRALAVRTIDGYWLDPEDPEVSWHNFIITEAWNAGTLLHLVKGAEL